jgi:hypothetical protein
MTLRLGKPQKVQKGQIWIWDTVRDKSYYVVMNVSDTRCWNNVILLCSSDGQLYREGEEAMREWREWKFVHE